MKSHKDLDVWKKSVDLVEMIYEITKHFPKEEIYCLTNQIRRASISVASNIAEGAGRNHNKEFVQMLYIAQGSLSEIDTQLVISVRLKYLAQEGYDNISKLINDIRLMLIGLIKYIKNVNDR